MNVPKLRFKEMIKNWTRTQLSEISDGGQYGMNAASMPYDGENKYLRITDIDDETRQFNFTHLTSPSGKLDDKYLLKNGDLLFARTGASVGKSYLYHPQDGKCYFAGFLIKYHINQNVDARFIYFQTLTQYYKKWVKIHSMRSGQPGINAEEYSEFEVGLTSLNEQQKIASFLSSIDEKITQLSKKHELLCQYKKGMMQKLFSQEIRFKDEDGREFSEWKKLKASEIFENYTNKRHDGNLTILAATQDNGVIPRDQIDIDIKSSENSIKSYKIIEKGNFVISLRSFQGGIELSNYYGICSPAYTVLKATILIISGFYKNYLKTYDFIQKLNSTVIGIRDGKQISYQAFSTLMLDYPCVEEQTKIANFLSSIDDKIENVTKQIEQAKLWKKGLLQQMFV